MSGHNKWSKIKHKKAATDAKKSKMFSKHAHLIALESKKAGGDVSSPGLAAAIERARSENMPKENIDRAVKRGASKDAEQLEEVLYEFYGPAGTAFIVEAVTDNANRTTQEIKHLLSRRGFSLGTQGSATWAFTKEGKEWIPTTTITISDDERESFQELFQEIEEHDDVQQVYTTGV